MNITRAIPHWAVRPAVGAAASPRNQLPGGGSPVATSGLHIVEEGVGDGGSSLFDADVINIPAVIAVLPVGLEPEPYLHLSHRILGKVYLLLHPLTLAAGDEVDGAPGGPQVFGHLYVAVVLVALQGIPVPEGQHRHRCHAQVYPNF
ncbi:hypothetical protein ES703_70734 [subsurface metagenome]